MLGDRAVNRITAIIGFVVVCLFASMGWAINYYRDNATEFKKQLNEKNQALNLANATIMDMTTRQRDVAALDAKYTQELADAKAENDDLQRKLNNGGRMLVKGRCPMPSSNEAASTSSVGHEATVELSDVAGRNVLGIRSGIQQDQSALRALQEYINTQCLK